MMTGKCVRCGQYLTSPASVRRKMGATCALRKALESPAEDAVVLEMLRALLAEAHEEGAAVVAEIAAAIAEVERYRFYPAANPLEMARAVEWHLGIGRSHSPIPADLEPMAQAVIHHGYTGKPLMFALVRYAPALGRRDAWEQVRRLAAVVEEVGALTGAVREVA